MIILKFTDEIKNIPGALKFRNSNHYFIAPQENLCMTSKESC